MDRSGRSTSSKSSEGRRERRGGKKPSHKLKKHVYFTVEGAEEQTNIDESERLAVYLNSAAKRIQKGFRQFQQQEASSESEGSTESNSEDDAGPVVHEMDAERIQHIVTNVFILLYSIGMMMKRWIVKCLSKCTSGNQKRSARRHKNRGSNEDEDDPELVDTDDLAADGDIVVDGGDAGNMQGQPQTGPTTTAGPTAPAP